MNFHACSPALAFINHMLLSQQPVKEDDKKTPVTEVNETVIEKASVEASQPSMAEMDATVVELHEDLPENGTAPSGSILDKIRAGGTTIPQSPKQKGGKGNTPPEFFKNKTQSAKHNQRRKG